MKDPPAHFPPQRDGDLVEDGVCSAFTAEKLGVSAPTASEHLKVLTAIGLLSAREDQAVDLLPARRASYRQGEAHDAGRPVTPSDQASASRPPDGDRSAYERLMATLDAAGARYRVIEHPPEGRTIEASAHRGHPVGQAAKCLVVMVKIGKRTSRYFLAVVPGDARVDLAALKALAGGTYVAFASTDRAETLAGSETGTILPFSSHPDLHLVADPGLLEHDEIFFNAARLDRSLALATKDYLRLADPQVERIVAPDPDGGRHR